MERVREASFLEFGTSFLGRHFRTRGPFVPVIPTDPESMRARACPRPRVTRVGRLRIDAAWYAEPGPAVPGRRGPRPPKTKGPRPRGPRRRAAAPARVWESVA